MRSVAFGAVALVSILLFGVQSARADQNLYYVYKNIAEKALSRNDVPMAEVMYANELEQAELFGENDPRLIGTIIKLADLYAKNDEYAMAEPLYTRLVGIVERHPEYSRRIAASLENCAGVERRTHSFARAHRANILAEILTDQTADNVQKVQLSNTGFGM